jgi:hypothetical protein
LPIQKTFTKAKEDRMKFRPLHDRVVVRRIEAEEKTTGGIIFPSAVHGVRRSGLDLVQEARR